MFSIKVRKGGFMPSNFRFQDTEGIVGPEKRPEF